MNPRIKQLAEQYGHPAQLDRHKKSEKVIKAVPFNSIYPERITFPIDETSLHNAFSNHMPENYHLCQSNITITKKALHHFNVKELTKGLILCGPVGVGKSELMNILMNVFAGTDMRFIIINYLNLLKRFKKYGDDVFDYINSYQSICIDEFGIKEDSTKRFGNESDVLMELWYERMRLDKITHLTANLNQNDLLNNFGERMQSRIKANSRLLNFPQSARNYRNNPV